MINKSLITALVVSVILTFSFGYLSYHYNSELGIAKGKITEFSEKNKSLRDEIKRMKASKEIDDIFTIESFDANKKLSDIERDTLSKIDAIEQNRGVKTDVQIPKVKSESKSIDEAGIDDRLPDDLTKLLHDTYSNLRNKK